MTWVSWPTEEQEPYDPAKIHVSHGLECVGEVGHCKVCLEAWVGEVMTPGLAAPCTKVKPRLDPMTELMGFGVVED